VSILTGDCRTILPTLDAGSVRCCVTSPPYWNLRDYGTATWEGGSAECGHTPEARGDRFATPASEKQRSNTGSETASARDCSCGARRIDAQLGLERTPEEYVAAMVGVFREVKRVLADDGTLWMNLGSSYASSGMGGNPEESDFRKQATNAGSLIPGRSAPPGFKPKDMVPIPWMVAMALQADGWYLRSDIIWHKPNPMPESVTDRPTKAHEYVFLLSKNQKYFYDAGAIAEISAYPGDNRAERTDTRKQIDPFCNDGGSRFRTGNPTSTTRNARNARTVWTADEPLVTLRFDLSEADRSYVLGELMKRGL
jgi:site-specific DNA-methyltransferase (cytosine-N4-specific)